MGDAAQEQQTLGFQSFVQKIKQLKNANKVTKKDTIKSIDWVQSEDGQMDEAVFEFEKNDEIRTELLENNLAKSRQFPDLFSTLEKMMGDSV